MAANVSPGTKWRIMILIFLFYFLGLGFTNQFFNVMLRTMQVDMGWDAAQTTAISTAIYGAMVWFVFVAGAILDKVSVRKIFVLEMILVGIAFALRGVAQGFMFWFALIVVYGVLSAFYIPTVIKLTSLWFDGSQIALANGILTAGSPCGQLVANLAGYKIAMAIGGWKVVFIATGIIMIILAVLSWFMIKERRSEDAALKSDILKKEDMTFWRNIAGVLRTPGVWIYSLANACFLGMVYAMMTYQNFVYQTDPQWALDPSVSGTIPASSNMVSMCAYVLVPFVFGKLGIMKHWHIAAIITAVVAVTSAMFMSWFSYDLGMARAGMAISGLMYGCCLTAPRVLMLKLPEVSGPRAGTAQGFYSTVERLGVTIFVAIVGPQVVADPVGSSVVMGEMNMIMYLHPVLLLIALFVNKKRYGNIHAIITPKAAPAETVAEAK